ncbi:YifB family Mg chelatase-like AAA ATPase [Anaerobacillus sp. MEB173]|uniref:YifB family Mg chelatase-like AAA ATPase n=1 Tax=Anaerobacillus sp. MEB173 TaxID=3383345 RepID=UPI003F92EEB7
MAATIFSFAIKGVDGYPIEVEADTVRGIKSISIVGLGDTAVKEAKERLESAIISSGFQYPEQKMIINLAPSHMKKSGSHFDVPMAIALLKQTKQINISLDSFAVIGELSLNSVLRPCSGVLPMTIEAKKQQFKHMIVPLENVQEASLVKEIQVIGCHNLHDVIQTLAGNPPSHPYPLKSTPPFEPIDKNIDFSDVRGQQTLIEYMTVAAAGGHNFLMIGPPGCGKSMIAQRVPSILPPLHEEESLEVTKIYSVAKKLNHRKLIRQRPFRAPHHNASTNSLIGGGTLSMPGEISLAHNGVLFLDEIAEFPKKTLDALRQPMEDRQVTISRVQSSNTYPANFMLIAAMNPCPCGYFGLEKCRCSDYEVLKYRNRLSGPILDRIDIQKYVNSINIFECNESSSSSKQIREKVLLAREFQQFRYKGLPIRCNAELNASLLQQFCQLNEECETLMKKAYNYYNYSGRTLHKFLKVSRTFADLDQSEEIRKKDILASLMSRDLDRERKNMAIF